MLVCTDDGGKLPPYVVFKPKTLPEKVKWPKGITVRCQAKGWMDNQLVWDSMLQHRWADWYGKEVHSYTGGCNMKKPELEEICGWIIDAWQELNSDIITKAFKKCSHGRHRRRCFMGRYDLTETHVNSAEIDLKDNADVHDNFYADQATNMTENDLLKFLGLKVRRAHLKALMKKTCSQLKVPILWTLNDLPVSPFQDYTSILEESLYKLSIILDQHNISYTLMHVHG